MPDNVERHNSTRWAKASVPTYGDEWGDEYDYDDIDEQEEDQVEPQDSQHHDYSIHLHQNDDEADLNPSQHHGIAQEPPHHVAVESDHANFSVSTASKGHDEPLYVPADNLVLSIDNFRSRRNSSNFRSRLDSDSSDDDDFGIGASPEPSVHEQEVVEPQRDAFHQDTQDEYLPDQGPSHTQSIPSEQEHNLNPQTVQHQAIDSRIRSNFEDLIMPPTPTHNSDFFTATPQSERSFASDTDSIQKESDLKVFRASSRKRPPEPINEDIGDIHKSDTISERRHEDDHDHDDEVPHVVVTQAPLDSAEPGYSFSSPSSVGGTEDDSSAAPSAAPAPLVLSIDRKDPIDSDSDDDDWGYQGQSSTDDEQPDALPDAAPYSEPGANTDTTDVQPKGRDLDDLIDDLQNNSLIHDNEDNASGSFLPSMKSIQDMSLPDFGSYDANEKEEKDEPVSTNISPSPVPVEPLNVSRGSIRKPPPRTDLVSVDYSNIADAVSGYLSDEERQKSENLNDIDEDNESLALQPTESSGSLSTGKFSFAQSQISGTQFNEGKSVGLPTALPVHNSGMINEIKTSGLPPLPLQPDSAGASSSVYSSVNPSPLDFMPPRSFDKSDLSRRDSTMTTNTFNMGTWQPNTNNFRDQFINDNEKDGRMSYNPVLYDKETTANYNKFTTLGEEDEDGEEFEDENNHNNNRTLHDNQSSSLDRSIPDTIDAAIPRVSDEEDEDDVGDDSIGKINKIKTVDTLDSKPLSTGTFGESVLKDPPGSKGLFKEEKVTPMTSMLDIGGSGKESSATTLKEPSKSENSSQRVVSKTSTTASTFVSAGTGGVYPPYNWKNIMAKSQSIDRIQMLKDALQLEAQYDSGLNHWLSATLKISEESPTIHIGKIATAVYQNAPHSDIRRHNSLRTTLSIVKDKVETSGMQTSSLGKRFFHRSKKFIKSSD